MTTYERVRFYKGGRRATVLLRDVNVADFTIGGTEVDRFGDDVIPKGHDSRYRIISKDLVIKRAPMQMNLVYCELEAIDKRQRRLDRERSKR